MKTIEPGIESHKRKRGIIPFPFSRRLETTHELSPLFLRRAEIEAAGRSVIDLVILNPTLVNLEYPVDQIRSAIAAGASAHYDPHPLGACSAREAVSADFMRRGVVLDPSHICITASTSDSLGMIFKLIADPGDRVLVPRPGYPLLDEIAPLEGLVTGEYAVDEDGNIALSSDDNGCRILFAMAPHMPLGAMPLRNTLDQMDNFCARHGVALILDEVFADYAEAPPGEMITNAPLVFRLGGLSKTAGLPGVKLGWIAAQGKGAAEAMQRLERIADAYLSPNQIAMNALPALFQIAPSIRGIIAERVRSNLDALRASILAPRLISTGATWTAVLTVDDDESVSAQLLEGGWWVHPGYLYDFTQPRIVLSLLTPPDSWREALAAMERILK